ncbi:MAG: FAD-binding protein, partial [Pseudomonadota bacterium]
MSTDIDVCVIGSGAGGGPVALTLAEAGYSVVVLEKGPWFTEQDFYKDEIACCR